MLKFAPCRQVASSNNWNKTSLNSNSRSMSKYQNVVQDMQTSDTETAELDKVNFCSSIYPKLVKLAHFLSTLSALPDILWLPETFLNCRQNPFISGYQVTRKDLAISLGRGGGVFMFIETNMQFNQLTESKNLENGNEVIGIQVSDTTLINLYNSPMLCISLKTY